MLSNFMKFEQPINDGDSQTEPTHYLTKLFWSVGWSVASDIEENEVWGRLLANK